MFLFSRFFFFLILMKKGGAVEGDSVIINALCLEIDTCFFVLILSHSPGSNPPAGCLQSVRVQLEVSWKFTRVLPAVSWLSGAGPLAVCRRSAGGQLEVSPEIVRVFLSVFSSQNAVSGIYREFPGPVPAW